MTNRTSKQRKNGSEANVCHFVHIRKHSYAHKSIKRTVETNNNFSLLILAFPFLQYKTKTKNYFKKWSFNFNEHLPFKKRKKMIK